MGVESWPGGSTMSTGEDEDARSRRDMTMRSARVRGRPMKRAKPRDTGIGGRNLMGRDVVRSLRIKAQR